jgi:pyrroline-5-carboxylate reductase
MLPTRPLISASTVAMRAAPTITCAAPRGIWTPSVGFLGFGVMAQAMTTGFQHSPAALFRQYYLCDLNQQALTTAQENITSAPVQIAESAEEVVANSEVVVLAVKPQSVAELLSRLPITKDHLLVSIVAGWSIDRIRATLPKKGHNARVIRTMPNTPLQVRKGCTLFARCDRSTKADADLIKRMFSSCGICDELKESQLDAATALAGSGPAFVAVFMDALADGAVKQGIPRDLALKLAAHVVEGSAKMCTKDGGGLHPAVLRDRVCSPGGTSIHGVGALEDNHMRKAVIAAIQAATERSKELSVQ